MVPHVMAHFCNPSTQEEKAGRLQIQADLSKIARVSLKKTKCWGCNSVVEHLPSLHKALGSTLSSGKKKIQKQPSGS
jgi:hypothetical protein